MELCLNYKSLEANWEEDAGYFKKIGVTGIRPHMPAVNSPWAVGSDTPGGLAYIRRQARYFADRGFYVTWGIAGLNGFNGAGQLTATAWADYEDVVLAEAQYLQDQGIAITFEIGNELEDKADGTTLTVDQLITNLCTLATAVKAIYTIGKVAYSPWDYAGTTYDKWIAKDIAGETTGLDYLNAHSYCNSVNDRAMVYGTFVAQAKLIAQFGPDRCDITEGGMEAGAAAVAALPAYLKRAKIKEMWKYSENLGFRRFFVYSYVGNQDANNDFAMKYTDGTFDPQWDAYLSRGGRYTQQTS